MGVAQYRIDNLLIQVDIHCVSIKNFKYRPSLVIWA